MISFFSKKISQPWYVRLLGWQLTQITLAVLFLALDFVSGPLIQFPIAYIIPVVLAAHFSHQRLSYALAIIQPVVRLGFVFVWDNSGGLIASSVNAVIRVAVLLIIARFINRMVRLAGEVKRLEGLLPICSYCKKIRNERNEWQKIETYISKNSQADFTHSICPDCAHTHFGAYLDESRKA
jgi:hypothetical protein